MLRDLMATGADIDTIEPSEAANALGETDGAATVRGLAFAMADQGRLPDVVGCILTGLA